VPNFVRLFGRVPSIKVLIFSLNYWSIRNLHNVKLYVRSLQLRIVICYMMLRSKQLFPNLLKKLEVIELHRRFRRQFFAENGDCRRKRRDNGDGRRIRRPSHFSATVAAFCYSRCFRRQIVPEIGNYSRQCGQTLTKLKTGSGDGPKTSRTADCWPYMLSHMLLFVCDAFNVLSCSHSFAMALQFWALYQIQWQSTFHRSNIRSNSAGKQYYVTQRSHCNFSNT